MTMSTRRLQSDTSAPQSGSAQSDPPLGWGERIGDKAFDGFEWIAFGTWRALLYGRLLFYQLLAAADPRFLTGVATFRCRLADAALMSPESERGFSIAELRQLRSGVGLYCLLVKRFPKNLKVKACCANWLTRLAWISWSYGKRPAGALPSAGRSVAMLRDLARRDSSRFQPALAEAVLRYGQILEMAGRGSETLPVFTEAVRLLRPNFLRAPLDHARTMLRAVTYLLQTSEPIDVHLGEFCLLDQFVKSGAVAHMEKSNGIALVVEMLRELREDIGSPSPPSSNDGFLRGLPQG